MKIFWILTWDNLKNSLRTRKAIIFLVLYLLVFGLITYAFFHTQEVIETQIREQGISQVQQGFMSGFAHSILSNKTENSSVVDFIFGVPPINMVLFFISLIGTPLLLFILNYDKISQEIYDGTIRYILFRASRFKVFFAKFFSSLIECSVITFAALILGILWGSLRFQSVNFIYSMQIGVRYWLIAQFFLAAFIAFSLMASAIFKKPFIALIFSVSGYIAMAVIPFFIPYISPYDKLYFQGLFLPNSLELLLSLFEYGLYTAIFLTIGYQIFKRADL